MAIALRSSTKAYGSATATHTVSAPSGAASGDVLYGFWFTSSDDTWAVPGGWTSVSSGQDAAYGSFVLARLVLSGAPAGSYAATSGGFVDSWGIITAWTGCDTGTPEDLAAASALQADPYEAPSLTTVTNGAVLACFYGGTGDATGTKDASQTLIDSGAGGPSYLASYEARPTAGATGVRALTGWADRAQCVSLAIRPAAAGGGGGRPNALLLLGVG